MQRRIGRQRMLVANHADPLHREDHVQDMVILHTELGGEALGCSSEGQQGSLEWNMGQPCIPGSQHYREYPQGRQRCKQQDVTGLVTGA